MTAADLAAWRNDSLRAASGASSKREMTLIGQVFALVRKEWRRMAQNPLSDIRRPKAVPPRDRRVSENEIERIKVATGQEVRCVGLGADGLVSQH